MSTFNLVSFRNQIYASSRFPNIKIQKQENKYYIFSNTQFIGQAESLDKAEKSLSKEEAHEPDKASTSIEKIKLDLKEAMTLLGFTEWTSKTSDMITYTRSDKVKDKNVNTMVFLDPNGEMSITQTVNGNSKKLVYTPTTDVATILKRVEHLLNKLDIQVFEFIDASKEVFAAINTKDLAKKLVRVKSSNVWAIGINVRHQGDTTGDVLAQFKGKNGGPGDVYIYYDVPIKVYNRWVAATSIGHFFWKYIRNNFMYSKLTGDKRGKLRNAIN